MSFKAEDIVALLASNPSVFSLGGDMPEFKEGFADLVSRVRALEEWRKAMNEPQPDRTP